MERWFQAANARWLSLRCASRVVSGCLDFIKIDQRKHRLDGLYITFVKLGFLVPILEAETALPPSGGLPKPWPILLNLAQNRGIINSLINGSYRGCSGEFSGQLHHLESRGFLRLTEAQRSNLLGEIDRLKLSQVTDAEILEIVHAL